MYECPNCGGELRFDIASQKLRCEHCGSSTEYTSLKEESAAKETEDVNIFRCPNCGGEVMSTNLTASEYCTYCGAFVMLERKKGSMRKADVIVPFKRTKEEVKELYRKAVSGKIYAPSAMKNPEFLDRFRGIYMPYWLYDVKLGPDIRMTGTTSQRDGDYRIEKTHALTCKSEILFDGIPYDASSTFRDNLGQAVTPYEEKDMIPFTPGVMLGFFADQADTPAKTYEEDAKAAAVDAAFDKIVEAAGFKNPKPEKPDNLRESVGALKLRVEKIRSAYFPVWFLTWRDGDRVSYSVVNGQTGEVCAELPISFWKYLMFSLLFSVPLFFLTQLFLTLTPYTMLAVAGVLAVAMGEIYNWQLKQIVSREMHGDDKGYLRTHPELEERYRQSNAADESVITLILGALFSVFTEIPLLAVVLFFCFAGGILDSFASDFLARLIWGGVLLAGGVLSFIRSRRLSGETENRAVGYGAFGTSAAALVSAVITILHPVQDLWYYGGSMIAIAAVICAVFYMVRFYNLMVTSAVPHLFERNKGDGTEKKYSDFGAVSGAPRETREEKAAGGQTVVPGTVLKNPEASAWERFFGETRKSMIVLLMMVVTCIAVLFLVVSGSESISFGAGGRFAPGRYGAVNSATGYSTFIADEKDLLTAEEEEALLQDMYAVTEYGNAAMLTADAGGMDTDDFARRAYKDIFGEGVSGTMFLIDMGNRNLWIHSDGAVYKTITKSWANSICDNIYKSASRGDYYGCATEAFRQISAVLAGEKVARPMKLITGALLSLLLSCILNYFLIAFTIRVKAPEGEELAGTVIGAVAVTAAANSIIRTNRVYDPPSSSSGGSGGGGGGSSGGGGGHGF